MGFRGAYGSTQNLYSIDTLVLVHTTCAEEGSIEARQALTLWSLAAQARALEAPRAPVVGFRFRA